MVRAFICGEGIYPCWGAKRPPLILPDTPQWQKYLGLLRTPAGINPLATGTCFVLTYSSVFSCPSQPPPNAAINCTLAINRLCCRLSTLRSLLKAVAWTVTTSR